MPVKRPYYQSGNCSSKVTKPLLMTILTVLMLACQMLQAEVVLMKIEGRELLEDSRVFGKSGQYEKNLRQIISGGRSE